ncbi:trafficking protein particle complex subunit 12 isoform X1 [Bacillus rossius redtenbacheri]|uniref:trafficking protein particle complex subunit 12 isoform X1 n=1 Tax=Bacillus rossius redtenbacheri TaxID=93214 RepID=UPI002FDE6541
MDNQNTNAVDHPSLRNYFSQDTSVSQASTFFDRLPSANGPAMMTSVRESASSHDLFKAANSQSFPIQSSLSTPLTSAMTTVSSTTIMENFRQPLKTDSDCKPEQGADLVPDVSNGLDCKTLVKEEPVVCKIFSQEACKNSDKNFFDLISPASNQQFATSAPPSKPSLDLIIPGLSTSVASSMMTSPDFSSTTGGSFPTSSPLVTPTPPGEMLEPILSDSAFGKSSGAHPSEVDRRRDAWIPCDRTRQALIAVATSSPGSYTPDRELLTMPGVVMEGNMVDTVHEFVNHLLGEAEAAKRQVLTANDVTQDVRGLRELIQAGCYRAAVNLTSQLLTIYGQGVGRSGHPSKHTVHSIQLWFTRIALLVKLRSFSLAESESEPFGDLDRPDLYFQFYPELHGGRPGSMAPFAFRLLLAELPQYTGRHREALSRLHALLATTRKIIKNLASGLCEDGSRIELSPSDRAESKKLWVSREVRVLHSIVNCAIYQKDFSLAVELMELILGSYDWPGLQRRDLHSALGRIYLQLGDLAGAEKNFAVARELRHQQRGSLPSEPDLRDLVDKGLMAVADNNFQEAHEYFQKALEIDPANIMLLNNMGICCPTVSEHHGCVLLPPHSCLTTWACCPTVSEHHGCVLLPPTVA